MRTRTKALLGMAIGAVLAVTTAIAPASAAKPGGGEAAVAAGATCGSFNGLVVTAPSVSYPSVTLYSGEVITARVSPALSGQSIFLMSSIGLSFSFYEGAATSGLAFQAPGSTTYSLGWSIKDNGIAVPSNLTWTFSCSTGGSGGGGGGGGGTAPADDDRDGVVNSSDSCAGTVLPDSVRKKAAGSYYATASGAFVDGTGRSAGISVADAGGCSATQIAKAVGLNGKNAASGIPLTTLTSWAGSH